MQQARMVPSFRLPALGGGTAGTADHFQRRELVLAALHGPECERCSRALLELASRRRDVEQSGAALLVVLESAHGAVADLPFPCVRDADGRVGARLAAALESPAGGAWLLSIDRFGEICRAEPVHDRDPAALLDQSLEWVDFIQKQCPE